MVYAYPAGEKRVSLFMIMYVFENKTNSHKQLLFSL